MSKLINSELIEIIRHHVASKDPDLKFVSADYKEYTQTLTVHFKADDKNWHTSIRSGTSDSNAIAATDKMIMEYREAKGLTVTILDTEDGQTVEHSGMDYFWWTEGNGSCDCNREIFSGKLDEENDTNMCKNCERFLIVGVKNLPEEYDEGVAVREMNDEYPKELIAKHADKYPLLVEKFIPTSRKDIAVIAPMPKSNLAAAAALASSISVVDTVLEDFSNMMNVMPEEHGEKIIINPDEVLDLVKKHKIAPNKVIGNQLPMNLFLRDLIINCMLAESQYNEARDKLTREPDNETAIGCAIMEVTLRDRKTMLKQFCVAYIKERQRS